MPGPTDPGAAGDGATGGDGDGQGAPGAGAAGPVGQRRGTASSDRATGGATGNGSFPGVTAKTIALGISYCNDCDEANAAAGAGSPQEDVGDTRKYHQAAIDDVNKRGGVLGRKLVPVFHEISASTDFNVGAQEACETWTKDNKVAVIFYRGEIAAECARKAGIIVVGGSAAGPVFQRYPNLFAPAAIRLERLGAVTVNAMVKAGWHKPSPEWPTGKIGLITWDNPDYHYIMKNGYLKALHAAGLKETDVRYVAVPQSDKSLADASAAISSAILAFREKGIDHVFIADGPAGIFDGTGLTFTFLHGAKAQRYYPRYGFNSNNSPGWKELPPDQQVGMLAVDSYDIERANDAGITLNPQRERCWALMSQRGLRATDATYSGSLSLFACEYAWFAEALFKRTNGLSLSNLIAAGEALGTSYRSPFVYGTKLGKSRHDGSYLFRNSAFHEGCACMKYTSKTFEPQE